MTKVFSLTVRGKRIKIGDCMGTEAQREADERSNVERIFSETHASTRSTKPAKRELVELSPVIRGSMITQILQKFELQSDGKYHGEFLNNDSMFMANLQMAIAVLEKADVNYALERVGENKNVRTREVILTDTSMQKLRDYWMKALSESPSV